MRRCATELAHQKLFARLLVVFFPAAERFCESLALKVLAEIYKPRGTFGCRLAETRLVRPDHRGCLRTETEDHGAVSVEDVASALVTVANSGE